MAVNDPVKQSMALIKTNMIGAIAGLGVTYVGINRYTQISNRWAKIGLTILGGVAGAYLQGEIMKRSGYNKSLKNTK